ncbi:PREDICTED: uncharacterized protein LOC109125019 [Camelina sativa]|uniref:Uncharacterized protein LOC104743494 n=1 Tax=Camelina sativa TaxID=90675 RepID=A0ABM1RL06_CAMSA|nr:PREDICTED: uncharacterized protein LOC104743494 [Camelina sativa]XP_010480424.1 PREDICTED: uncharacterized protein LOC104759164 [Camelina sativa]XP_019099694.1 PREDICTED: uncharacterized protein LOC109125019 [Camelina sativa]
MSFIYGDPVPQNRVKVWDKLSDIGSFRVDPWFMIGDFNELSGNHEKRGGALRPASSFVPFNSMIRHCGMLEFPCYGEHLSWRGNRCNNQVVRCRLDRALGNEDWQGFFPNSKVDYLDMIGSDHCPILATCLKTHIKRNRQFRFDKCWLGKDGLSGAVESGWNRTINFRPTGFVDKIKNCRNSISWWRKNNIFSGPRLISSLKAALQEAKMDDSISQEEIRGIERKLKEAYRDEELYWQQKSRKFWLRVGDKNTKFFQASTKQRRVRNRIIGLFDTDNVWNESASGMENIATKYFEDLFRNSDAQGVSEMLQEVTPLISDTMNRDLIRDISEAEVRKALFAMHPEKTPGPDGMTALFFQRFWSSLKGDLVALVREFFRSGRFDPCLNETNICLIPKVDRPQRMAEFRPISLCNVSYKIISKILCFRLKRFLPSLVSETQSAFVSGRLITDNILVAQEMFHGLNTNNRCKSEFLAFKTDMSKAYDRVEWAFLEAVMVKLGFDRNWISWIMWCVSSVSYQVLLNGQPRGFIKPQRGLRQGDPLSPYLFILCTEVLIANIKKAEREKKVTGITIARDSPTISHLLFADDSLFFCKAEATECQTVMEIIRNYGKASGQEVNLEKSSIMFGKKVPTEIRDQLKSVIGITKEGGMGSYLGIPESLQGSKNKVFGYVKDRLDDRVNGWNAKLLSKGGKEIMIKSVALALPTHVMSCYKLPQELTSKLTSAISTFWWKSNDKAHGLHWVAWDKLCKDKCDGGLGFRALEQFNDAMLAKQYWRLIQHPTSLMARVLKGRYFSNKHPLMAKKPSNPSFAWRSIFSTKDLVEYGARWAVGSGSSISVWRDPWIPDIRPRPANGRGRLWLPSLMVNHLINPVTKDWHLPTLEEFLDPGDIPIIRRMSVSKVQQRDRLVWHFTKSGKYTVKSGYRLARELMTEVEYGPTCMALRAQVWKLDVPPKVQHFFWQIASGTLPVLERLAYRGIRCDTLCKRCGAAPETINHALFECPRSLDVWELSLVSLVPDGFPFASIYANLDFIFWRAASQSGDSDVANRLPWILWTLWKDRNKKVFQGLQAEPTEILHQANNDKLLWEEAKSYSDRYLHTTPLVEDRGAFPRCQIDGSWKGSDAMQGLGWWCCSDDDATLLLGARSQRCGPTSLHAELQALIWAMESLLAAGVGCQSFETDCAELVAMVQTPDDWPSFSNLLSSPFFKIAFL